MKDKPIIAQLAANIGLLMRASCNSARSIEKKVRVAKKSVRLLLGGIEISQTTTMLILLSMADGQHDQDLAAAFRKSLTFYGTFDREGYFHLSENLKR